VKEQKKIEFMKKKILNTCLIVVFGIGLQTTVSAQEDEPVTAVWEGRLGNHQTADLPAKGQTSVFIVHYFDKITAHGIDDWFGIYGTANLQMGFERGLSDHLSAFFLTEKLNKTHELGIRYQLARQNLNDESPVSMAVAFSISADARNKKFFGDNYYFIDRFFYTAQLAVSREVGSRWQLMSNTSFVHFNIVPEKSYSDFISENLSVAWKMNRKRSLFASCDFPLGAASASEESPQKPKPVFTVGTIMSSRSHNFQVFLSNGNQISLGKELLNNHSGFTLKDVRIGFNIHVKIGGKQKT
jgi:hypothetical protein